VWIVPPLRGSRVGRGGDPALARWAKLWRASGAGLAWGGMARLFEANGCGGRTLHSSG